MPTPKVNNSVVGPFHSIFLMQENIHSQNLFSFPEIISVKVCSFFIFWQQLIPFILFHLGNVGSFVGVTLEQLVSFLLIPVDWVLGGCIGHCPGKMAPLAGVTLL
jgi:hypothetical protein